MTILSIEERNKQIVEHINALRGLVSDSQDDYMLQRLCYRLTSEGVFDKDVQAKSTS